MRYLIQGGVCFALVALLLQPATAQVFGGNPPQLKFYQLNTDTVRVIFPKELERQAREVAGLTHVLARQSPAILGKRLTKYDVVLQNQTTQSNAYVGIAPRRSEFYMMPDLSNIELTSLPWHHTLAIHEFRHIEQFSNFNRTIQRTLGLFLGQEGQALAMGAAVPDWFWEGDAVWQETVSTRQGRGALPHFMNAYRSLWVDGKNYSYQKLRNGSFRHYVPNHYDLGYLLVTHGREKYGDSLWTKVTQDALDYKGVFYPFQKALRRHTGLPYKQFVNEAFTTYQNRMGTDTLAQQVAAPFTAASRNNVQQYLFPQLLGDGTLLVVKTAYRQIPAWFQVDTNGKEYLLRVKDISRDHYFTHRNGKVVFTALRPDARWGWKEASELRVWDMQTDTVHTVVKGARLFMPDLSQDGRKAVAVHVGTDQSSALHVVELESGNVSALPNPHNYVYTYPRFGSDGATIISAVRNSRGEMALLQTNMANNGEHLLLPFSNTPLAYLQVSGDTLLFTAPGNGVDLLYFYNLQTGALQEAARQPNGNYQGVLDTHNQTLVWSSWSTDGYLLRKQSLSQMSIRTVQQLQTVRPLYAQPVTGSYPNLLAQVPIDTAPLRRYPGSLKLLNIHSWRPVLMEPDWGVNVFSENVLNTFLAQYGYNYNRNEFSHQLSGNIVYGGWLPVLSAGAAQTWNRSTRFNEDTLLTWNQSNFNAGISLPLNLTTGRSFRFLTFQSSINFDQLRFTGIAKDLLSDEALHFLSSSITYSQQSQRALQQIFPRWAMVYRLQYRNTVAGIEGRQLLFNGSWFVPGLFRNHHMVLQASLQTRDTLRGGRFSNNFPFARGYVALNAPRAWRVSANYHFPLLYPEIGAANLVYLLRLRGNMFYDYTQLRSLRTGRNFFFRTAGAELFFDTRIWNTFAATFGLRYSYLLDADLGSGKQSPHRFEIVLPLDLF